MAFQCMEELNGKKIGVSASCEWTDESSADLRIALTGILDTKNSNELNEAVIGELKLHPSLRTMVIDLAGITYISSTGIGTLSNILVHCKKNKSEFFLSRTPEKIKRIMSQLGFLVYFKFLD